MNKKMLLLVAFFLCGLTYSSACSILYYVDSLTGKIYAVNNEDYWYDVHPEIRIIPSGKHTYARLWYGWDGFAQGGINEYGLFFDGAVTPLQSINGYSDPENNMGDVILSSCRNVEEALAYLEQNNVGLTNAHMLLGDRQGNAVVVEWLGNEKKIIHRTGSSLMVTNFLLSDTLQGNFPCPRYAAMEEDIQRLQQDTDSIGLREIGNVVAKAVQIPSTDADGRKGGTLYSTFVNITDMQFVLIYKLDNTTRYTLDLRSEFQSKKKKIIRLDGDQH